MRTEERTREPETEIKAASTPPRPPSWIAGGIGDWPPGPSGPLWFESGDHFYSIYVWLLRFLGLLMCTVAWGGHFLMGGWWPGGFKLAVCTGLGLVAAGHSLFVRSSMGSQRDLREGLGQLDRQLRFKDVVLVTALMILSGMFLMWLVVGPPTSRIP